MGQRDSLNSYITTVKDKPFLWGKHDCLTFTNNAFHEMYGQGWADDWIGRYNHNMSAKELQKEFGYKSFIKAVDDKLTRINYIPPLGALIATKEAHRWITGFAMGISNGKRGVFLSEQGLIHLSFDVVKYSWVKSA